MPLSYRILGPLEVMDGDHELDIGGAQRRILLAVLLLNANRVVSSDRLIESIWGQHPPGTARGLLQGCISHLRRSLQRGSRGQQPIVTRPPGYLFATTSADLDLLRFDDLVEQARLARSAAERASLLSNALGCWRGAALDGLSLPDCNAVIDQLEDRRVSVLEQRVEAELALGVHTGLIPELRAAVDQYPTRERFWALLIAAQYGADRQSDALSTYGELRRTLVDQLGVEPGPTAQQLHRQVLAGVDPAELIIPIGADLAANFQAASVGPVPDTDPAPAQLPASPGWFIGRQHELAQLDKLVQLAETRQLGVISGAGGVGKTALALRWSHTVKDQFPDGQLYLDLGGTSADQLRPHDALTVLLQSLGVAQERIPLNLAQAAALFRTAIADKRVLLVLDNVADSDQVAALLSATKGTVTLVTGRQHLDGLIAHQAGRLIQLDVLATDEAMAVLSAALGSDRVGADTESAEQLAELCGYLPLALRIVAVELIREPHRSLGDQVELLRSRALDALTIGAGESPVRMIFEQAWRAVDQEARYLFGLLGLLPGDSIGTAGAAALAGVPLRVARVSLDRLVGVRLLEEPSSGRFSCHRLVHAYATERACHDFDAAERSDALQRYWLYMLAVADEASRLLCPQILRLGGRGRSFAFDGDTTAALEWLDAERGSLVRLVTGDVRQETWQLADALRGYFWLRRAGTDWLAVARAGRVAAEAVGDQRAMAAAEFNLGMAHLCLNHFEQALHHQDRALALCQSIRWEEGSANALGNLGVIYLELGDLERAASLHRRALVLNRRIGSVRGEAVNHDNLARVHLSAGRFDDARRALWRALSLHRSAGADRATAVTLEQLGVMHSKRGQLTQAEKVLRQALEIHLRTGNLNGQATTYAALATVLSQTGGESQEAVLQARQLASVLTDRVTEAFVLNRLGAIETADGNPTAAMTAHREALARARATGAVEQEIEALIGSAVAELNGGCPTRSIEYAEAAYALAHPADYVQLAAEASVVLATAHEELAKPNPKAALAEP